MSPLTHMWVTSNLFHQSMIHNMWFIQYIYFSVNLFECTTCYEIHNNTREMISLTRCSFQRFHQISFAGSLGPPLRPMPGLCQWPRILWKSPKYHQFHLGAWCWTDPNRLSSTCTFFHQTRFLRLGLPSWWSLCLCSPLWYGRYFLLTRLHRYWMTGCPANRRYKLLTWPWSARSSSRCFSHLPRTLKLALPRWLLLIKILSSWVLIVST